MFTLDQSRIQENILVVSFEPNMESTAALVRSIRNLAVETDAIRAAHGGKLCRILNFEDIYVPYIVLVMLFAEESRFLRGTFSDTAPDLHHVIVAHHKSVVRDIEHFIEHYQLRVGLVSDLDTAYNRAHLLLCDPGLVVKVPNHHSSHTIRIG
jgi:hypothetical protein